VAVGGISTAAGFEDGSGDAGGHAGTIVRHGDPGWITQLSVEGVIVAPPAQPTSHVRSVEGAAGVAARPAHCCTTSSVATEDHPVGQAGAAGAMPAR
jgi:hypothetical protein